MQTSPIATPIKIGIKTIPIVKALYQNISERLTPGASPAFGLPRCAPQRGHSSSPSGNMALHFGHHSGKTKLQLANRRGFNMPSLTDDPLPASNA